MSKYSEYLKSPQIRTLLALLLATVIVTFVGIVTVVVLHLLGLLDSSLFGTAGGPYPDILKIESEWPQFMHVDEADSIRVSLIRTSEQLFVPTVEIEGHLAGVATPVPYGTPGAPIDTAFGEEYRVSAVARLDAVAFSCSPSSYDYQSLEQSRIDWVWNCISTNPGDQSVNASVYVRWEPVDDQGNIIERQVWRSQLDILVKQSLLPSDQVTMLTLASGFLGSVFTAPWVYQRLRKKHSRKRESDFTTVNASLQTHRDLYIEGHTGQENRSPLQPKSDEDSETLCFNPVLSGIVEGMEIEGRYQILKCLGQGGMGTAYLALQKELDRRCVIKEVLSQDISNREQFEREAKMLASLSHPNLPTVYDYFLYRNYPFLVMQFIEGKTLEHLSDKYASPFDVSKVLKWTRQLLDALQYIHSQQPPIIHRDIKPSNICITSEGKAVLLDFGIARRLDQARTFTGAQALTADYAPIEQWHNPRGADCVYEYIAKLQAQGIRTGTYTDIYSLGGTIYFTLTLHTPPSAPLRVLGEQIPFIQNLNPEVPNALERVIIKAMALHPSERYQSAAEMLAALSEEETSEPI